MSIVSYSWSDNFVELPLFTYARHSNFRCLTVFAISPMGDISNPYAKHTNYCHCLSISVGLDLRDLRPLPYHVYMTNVLGWLRLGWLKNTLNDI